MKYLFLTAVIIFLFSCSAFSQSVIEINAPDATPVVISRDNYGVPHITAQNENAMFFGQGFAAAQDRLYQLEINRRVSQGTTAEIMGSEYLLLDQQTRTLFYTKEERAELFNNLPAAFKQILTSYTAGVNAYLDSMNANPSTYEPFELAVFNMQQWNETDCISIMQFYIRSFGQFGGEELTRLQELMQNGWDWFNENRPVNDPNAAVTIEDINKTAIHKYKYSGIEVRNEIIEQVKFNRNKSIELEKSLGVADKFGSFAVLVSPGQSSNGNVMLLGCPQMGEPEAAAPNVIHEVELKCPSFHAGGMTLAGIPMVIIGRNDHLSWTMTSGASDNSDIFIDSTGAADRLKYIHNGSWIDAETITDTIYVNAAPVIFNHYRTIHGPVLASDTLLHQLISLKMTFWNQELDMMLAFYDMLKSDNLTEFENAASNIPMSFNLFYAGTDQQVKYWHIGKYNDRNDLVDPRLPHKGDGSEEWHGFIPFDQLPSSDITFNGYLVNWNNKPVSWWNNGDNVPWIEASWVYDRVNEIKQYLASSRRSTSINQLKNVPNAIQSHGTYQMALELTNTSIMGYSIAPPGQSIFRNLAGIPSVHTTDQWPLHLNWQYKQMQYNYILTSAGNENTYIADKFELFQNFPNPFNPATKIKFNIPVNNQDVTLKIYNSTGEETAVLIDKKLNAGIYEVTFNSQGLSSGVYFYKLSAGSFTEIKKMILLK